MRATQFLGMSKDNIIAVVKRNRRDYRLVAEVNTVDLDTAYRLTNNIDDVWTKNPGVKVYVGESDRSTSVGDLLVKDNITYIVAAIGFVRIPS